MELENELPIYPETEYLGDLGVRLVDNVVSDELKQIFRRQEKNDLGIDAQIEFLTSNSKGSGRLLGAQIKCGKSFFNETTEEGFVFRGELKHYYYWTNYSLPIILFLCHPETKEIYWVNVTKYNSRLLKKTWKIVVPFKQKLGVLSLDNLKEIANEVQHGDVIEVALFRFLHEKYDRKIKIFHEFEMPRDFYGLDYMAEIDDRLTFITYYNCDWGNLTTEKIAEYYKWFEYNVSITSHGSNVEGNNSPILQVYLVSTGKNPINLSEDLVNYLNEFTDVETYKLEYGGAPFFYLTELDENNEYVYPF
ncbi:DUF4365 domain-containing protein [Bacillus pseudomycoides]|uniref:DUF4365 domain-containing protein n=1 Tax=Bacillus pseudomycoides TaxID=64104 RepID=UPI000BED5BCE|nr:DUF4365 domain-containing protein [Bacillus pseudomycoides]PED07912.1 hypothetical protein COO19_12315 [Bacillus pseudomycoides]PEI94372.1 hypothetical protein CN686_16320 [Bacillus pseudomycoides]PEK15589.1 hypothetical protein CN693_22315 [Bacillus pseudomycoides]PEM69198.1 hypothetical protein CN619_21995 [Bacillus pseudomycoides]PEO23729.1 hypothetical protein CN542_00610 [Bacillus pseudomycoides]